MSNQVIRKTDKVLVLDLDETLVHTYTDVDIGGMIDRKNPELMSRYFEFTLQNGNSPMKICGVERPGLQEFLIFANKYFDSVIVWTAGIAEYAKMIVDHIYRDIPQKPKLIWSRGHCEGSGTETKPYTKPLTKLENSRPDIVGQDILRRAIIIDDRDYTGRDHNPQNQMLIPPFDPMPLDSTYGSTDDALYKVKNWLFWPEIKHAYDIKKSNKSRPFQVPLPISGMSRLSRPTLIPTAQQLQVLQGDEFYRRT